MNKQSGIHYLHQRQQGADGVAASVPHEVARIRDTVVAGLGDLLQGGLDAVDDSLFELANNCRSNNDQNRYFEAMREIRIKRKGVERQFSAIISKLFLTPPDGRGAGSSVEQPIDFESLSLMGNDDLEEQVALNAMAGKAKAHFQGQLVQLEARFSQVYGAQDGVIINPLAPEHLGRAFIDAIQPMEIQIRERLILLKQFDRYVMSNLGMLLDEANRILVQAGVIPHFRHKGKTGAQHESSADKEHHSTESASAARAEASGDSAVFEQIRKMLAYQRSNAGIPQQRPSGQFHVVSAAELGELLNALPAEAGLLNTSTAGHGEDLSQGEATAIDLLQLIQKLLSKVERRDGRKTAMNEADEDLINLVSMLFEFILDDDNLSAPIQVLISRLQIPILKVVMRDKSFFSHGGHPARRLLNNLAKAGIGWSNSDEKARDKLYNQIHTIVQRILDEFDGDVSLFVTLNQEFDAFLERETRRSTLVEQRTRESERGRIKSQKAQATVDKILKEKLARYKLPETVHTIVINGWSRVMFLAYLRDDLEHRWNESVKVLDDLIWCLHPHHDEGERDQWVRVVPGLLKTLRAGLEEVSFNASKLDEMMAQLKHELAEAFRTNAAIETRQEPVAEASSDGSLMTDQIEDGQELEDNAIAEYMAKIDSIEIGSWVEFSLVNGAHFRCKLSAIIEDADCFVFVNRMGLKVIEKTRIELAREMSRGRLALLEQGALIDRALNAVVGSLRSKSA